MTNSSSSSSSSPRHDQQSQTKTYAPAVRCAVVQFTGVRILNVDPHDDEHKNIVFDFTGISVEAHDADGRHVATLNPGSNGEQGKPLGMYSLARIPNQHVPATQHLDDANLVPGTVRIWMEATATLKENGRTQVDVHGGTEHVEFDFATWNAAV